MKQAMKLYRYVSQSKLRMLERDYFPIDEGGISVFGVGITLSSNEDSPLTNRLEKLRRQLERQNLLRFIDSDQSSNFMQGSGTFVEYLMKDVVIWIMVSKSFVLLLGGSSRYLNFDNFSKENLPGVVPGSNRTAILNALTTLWRSVPHISNQELNKEDPWDIAWKDAMYGSVNGRQLVTENHDNSPYNFDIIECRSIQNYYEAAVVAYSYSPDYLIDNLEHMSIVYTDYRFQQNSRTPRGVEIRQGTRFIIGSPIYIAQVSPSGQ